MKLVATVLSICLRKDASSSHKFWSKVQESTRQVEAILQALWGCPPHALGCSWGLWRLRPHRNSRGALCPPALKHSIAPSPHPCLGSRGGWKPTTIPHVLLIILYVFNTALSNLPSKAINLISEVINQELFESFHCGSPFP